MEDTLVVVVEIQVEELKEESLVEELMVVNLVALQVDAPMEEHLVILQLMRQVLKTERLSHLGSLASPTAIDGFATKLLSLE